MKQKMISLDDHSFALAAKIKNFSGWIRRMLKLKEQGQDAVAIYRDLTCWVAAVNAEENEEVRSAIYSRVQENKAQKRLGEFE